MALVSGLAIEAVVLQERGEVKLLTSSSIRNA